jgi:TatD DNase family protein
LITVGTSVASSKMHLELAGHFAGVFATAGVHPHDADDGIEGLAELCRGEQRPVAIGECGLDYFYDHSDRARQRGVFAAQVELAVAESLPLVVHARDAWDDTFAVLDECPRPVNTVMHCFTGGPDEARRCLDRGYFLSFSGIVTFPKAPDVAAAAAMCPLDSMLVETDAPFLAPVPMRGKSNVPAWVTYTGAFIADLRGVTADSIASATWANSGRVYGLESLG